MARRNDGQIGLLELGGAVRDDTSSGPAGHLPLKGKALRGSGRQGAVPTQGALWQVKKRGSVGVSSHAENCGYDQRTAKSLQERGWHLYKDGEKVW